MADSPLLLAAELLLIGLALAASLLVRPWRMVDWRAPGPSLGTPLLAALVVLPWLWSWPGLIDLPPGLRWSGAPLAVLLLGWPLAVPVLTVAGLSTMVTTGASLSQAAGITLSSGLLPATAVLVMGRGVRLAFGQHPVAYLIGRAFAVPMLALLACSTLASQLPGHVPAFVVGPQMQALATLLLALGEASWTSAIVALCVALRPQWLATWTDTRQPGHRRAVRAPKA